ncbi:MAG: glycosyltransferase, partial [bacterium]
AKRAQNTAPVSLNHPPLVSVIVPVHNEEKGIVGTVEALLQQDYPPNRYELIFVDDRSTDQTVPIIRETYHELLNGSSFPSQGRRFFPPLKIILQEELLPGLSPKKSAVTRGIAEASGEVIATTDGDSVPPQNWLSRLVSFLPGEGGMVVGQVRFAVSPKDPWWVHLQALDYQAQMVCAAGLVGVGLPMNCSAASLLYSKESFERCGGFSRWGKQVSGDDDLLMQTMAELYPVVPAVGSECVVSTQPPQSWRGLWHQRARWASKVHRYSQPRKLLLGGVFAFYLNLALSPLWLLSPIGSYWVFGAWLGKMVLDLWVLRIGVHLFKDRLSWLYFLFAELLHPYFILGVTLKGRRGNFTWRQAAYRRGVVPSSL